jgi:outer membrane protein
MLPRVRRRPLACLAFLTVAAGTCLAAPAAALSLQDALAAAYQTNPQLMAARARLRATDEGVALATAQTRPSISASGSYGVSQGSVTGIGSAFNGHPLVGQVTITQPIYYGGRISAGIGRAKADVDAGREDLTLAEQSVLLDATQAYMDVIRDEAVVRLNQDYVRTLQGRLDAVQAQHDAGMVTRTDVDQARARLSQAKAGAASAQLQLSVSRTAFETVTGLPAAALDEVSAPPSLPASREAAIAVAVGDNPVLTRARAQARSSDYLVDEAVGAMLPQFSLSAQYQYLRDAAGTNIYATSGVQQNMAVLGQLTIPIYQGGGEEAGVRRAEQVRAQAQAAIVVAERSVRQEVENAWQTLTSTRVALDHNRAQALADQKAVEGVSQEQRGGERSVVEILNAQAELLVAQVAVEASRHDSILAAYRLLAAMGHMNARSLRLPVKLYDPREYYEKTANAWFGLGD